MTLLPHLLTPPTGDITVWTKPDCVRCNLVKRRLTEAGVPFIERDITADENAEHLEYFQKLGFRSAPITEHETTAFAGFIPAEIDRIIAAWRANHPAPTTNRVSS